MLPLPRANYSGDRRVLSAVTFPPWRSQHLVLFFHRALFYYTIFSISALLSEPYAAELFVPLHSISSVA